MNFEMNEYNNFLPRKDAAIGTNIAFKCENKFPYCSFQKYFGISGCQDEELEKNPVLNKELHIGLTFQLIKEEFDIRRQYSSDLTEEK